MHNLESGARRIAIRAGMQARKSRWRAGTIENFGGFMLIDLPDNVIVVGSRFDLTAEEVVEFCTERLAAWHENSNECDAQEQVCSAGPAMS